MKRICMLVMTLVLGGFCFAQAASQPPADTKPASSNIPSQEYPRLDSQRRAYFRIYAPKAESMRVTLNNTALTKDANGYWTGTTTPLDPGFHYYQLIIDGYNAADPASDGFFGAGSVHSGIEVPEQGVDFYDFKDVPHGDIRSHWYLAKSTGQVRQAYIYTPPDYDKNTTARYPVLYLQHGAWEDRRAWAVQGRTNFILDNLIAAGKAKPMIVVIEDGGIAAGTIGGTRRGTTAARGRDANTPRGQSAPSRGRGDANSPARGSGARGAAGMGDFGRPFVTAIANDIIPMVDSTYRTIPDRNHRAMAGLSMGGVQTYWITEAHLDKFAYIGVFSAPGFGFSGVDTAYNGLLKKPDEFAKQVKVLYISTGSKENDSMGRSVHQELEKAVVKHIYYEAPGTAHEFQTWRKSLYGFAQLLFQD